MGRLGTLLLMVGLVGSAGVHNQLWSARDASATVAVEEKRTKIEIAKQELGASETVFLGEEGSRKIFAVRGNELIQIAEENPRLRYLECGMPRDERLSRRRSGAMLAGKIVAGMGIMAFSAGIRMKIDD